MGILLISTSLAAHGHAAEPGGAWPEFLDHYCLECHDGAAKNGQLDLEAIRGQEPGRHPQIWEKVIQRLSARQMPPLEEELRPTEAEYIHRVAELAEYLNGIAAQSPDPGKVPAMRRLTRTEYQNAIRDLLAVEIDVSELLPKAMMLSKSSAGLTISRWEVCHPPCSAATSPRRKKSAVSR